MKNFAFALAAVAVLGAAPMQAQTFTGFTANNDGAEFWDHLSDDGTALNPNNCNSGFVVTGVAPVACTNQRPNTWLPYTGAAATTYWNNGGAWAPIIFNGGSFTFTLLGGTTSAGCPALCTGGDIAGANLDWGIFDIYNRSNFFSFNTAGVLPLTSTVNATNWGIYVDLYGGGRAYSDTDRQFAMFGFGRSNPSSWIIGIEDSPGGDWDYQDMLFQITAEDGGTPQDVVPEPATMTLLATGLVGMAAAKRRRNRK